MNLFKKTIITLTFVLVISTNACAYLTIQDFLKVAATNETITKSAAIIGLSLLNAWSFGLILESFTVRTIPEFLAHLHNDILVYKYEIPADDKTYNEAFTKVTKYPFYTVISNTLKNYTIPGMITGTFLTLAAQAKKNSWPASSSLSSVAKASSAGLLTILAGTFACYGYHYYKIGTNKYRIYNSETHFSDVPEKKRLLTDLMERTRRFSLRLTISANLGLMTYIIAQRANSQ